MTAGLVAVAVVDGAAVEVGFAVDVPVGADVALVVGLDVAVVDGAEVALGVALGVDEVLEVVLEELDDGCAAGLALSPSAGPQPVARTATVAAIAASVSGRRAREVIAVRVVCGPCGMSSPFDPGRCGQVYRRLTSAAGCIERTQAPHRNGEGARDLARPLSRCGLSVGLVRVARVSELGDRSSISSRSNGEDVA
ncbi:hypothetical protein [Angustibacter luteus]|uniref:hypothetical protein n=1 Tax=Angustibacter luteus TaxID=658456 RepID=UPI002FECB2B0